MKPKNHHNTNRKQKTQQNKAVSLEICIAHIPKAILLNVIQLPPAHSNPKEGRV
jgi:hypothetical protein